MAIMLGQLKLESLADFIAIRTTSPDDISSFMPVATETKDGVIYKHPGRVDSRHG